ncbi:MAG: hypothetical protein M0Q15_16415 [Nevskia sp.]|jgi:hypothetical protein|nr:hypothetical protein [Nevskia sp.]
MSEFSKYEAMHASGVDPAHSYGAAKVDGLDQLTGIRMLRVVYGLSLIEAKKISFEIDTGRPADTRDPGLEKEFMDALDDLIGDERS